jgi:very-short-patch-repair endonuclease
MQPYRSLAPVADSWCPTAYRALRITKLFGAFYALAAVAYFIFPPFLYGEEWKSGFALVACALLLHGVSYLVLSRNSLRPIRVLRLWAMRRACTPMKAANSAESEAETRLAAAFEAVGLTIHAQQRVKNQYGRGFEYRTDFAYLDPACGLRIDIEVDGRFKEEDDDIQRRMANRDRWFTETGWHVLRFYAGDCYRRPGSCVAAVRAYIGAATESHRRELVKLNPPHSEVAHSIARA